MALNFSFKMYIHISSTFCYELIVCEVCPFALLQRNVQLLPIPNFSWRQCLQRNAIELQMYDATRQF